MLEVEDLNVRYGRVHAVRGASLSVADGEVVAVLGANGAGKSSALKAILGLVPGESGRVRVANTEVTGWPPARRLAHGLALVPEGRRILVGLTVEENLLMGAYHRRGDRAAVVADVAEMRSIFPILGERRRQLAGQLSGGEQQMLAVARALMSRPRMLLLDEPSLGLAPMVTRQIMQIIAGFPERGVSVLLVEQNAHAALELAGRGYVLELGRIVLEGPASELLTNPRVQSAYLGGSIEQAVPAPGARDSPGPLSGRSPAASQAMEG